MMIGPTFADELRAAGVPLDGIAWSAGGAISYNADAPQAVRDQVAAVLAVHDPTAPLVMPRGRALRRALAVLVDGAASYPVAAPTAAQLARLNDLWVLPEVIAWERQLDDDVLDPVTLALAQARWKRLKALLVPSAAEIARIEAMAPTFGIALA